jgi:hypothetical protein
MGASTAALIPVRRSGSSRIRTRPSCRRLASHEHLAFRLCTPVTSMLDMSQCVQARWALAQNEACPNRFSRIATGPPVFARINWSGPSRQWCPMLVNPSIGCLASTADTGWYRLFESAGRRSAYFAGVRPRYWRTSGDGSATSASNGCVSEPTLDTIRRTYACVSANGGMPP